MKTIRYSYYIAIADTLELLNVVGAIEFSKRNIIREKAWEGSFKYGFDPDSKAPKGYQDVVEFLFYQEEISALELSKYKEEINKKSSVFQRRQLEEDFWTYICRPLYCDREESDETGELSKRTKDFLAYGAEDGCWHQEYRLACKDLKAQSFSMDEAEEILVMITGELTDKDVYQLKYAYENDDFEMEYRSKK